MSRLWYAIVFLTFISLLILSTISFSSYVKIFEPYNATLYANGSIYLGNVGPGQTFFINIYPNTTNNKGQEVSLGWNRLVASGLPNGWVVANSPLYTPSLYVEITPPPNASFGEYEFNVTAINIGNYSKIGNLTFKAYINVTSNVFIFNASPRKLSSGIGVPAYVYITINNTGVSDNPFVISIVGLPGFNQKKVVIAQHGTSRSFIYPIYEDTPGIWHTKLRISSLTSPSIYKTENITFGVKVSLENDFLALGKGTLIYPILYAPVYSIQYFIGLLSKYG